MPLEMSLRPALSEDHVRMVREARRNGVSAESLARQFKVDRVAVRNAIHGRPPYDKILDPPPVPYGVLEADRPLSDQQVRDIRLSAQAGASISDIKRRFHVARLSIRKALYGLSPYHAVPGPPALQRRRLKGTRRLTDYQVRAIRRRRMAGEEMGDICTRFKVNPTTARMALIGRSPYQGIDQPPPLLADVVVPRRVLTRAQVRQMRRLRLNGKTTNELRAKFRVSRFKVMDALLGRPPFQGIDKPPPFPPEEFVRGPTLTDGQVRSIRQLCRSGTPVPILVKRFGACKTVILRALYGRHPYENIRDSPPLPVPKFGPSLTPEQVGDARLLRRDGLTLPQLATRFGATKDVICSALFGYHPYDRVNEPPPLKPGSLQPKLSKAQVRKARRLRIRGKPLAFLAASLGVGKATVAKALYGRPPYGGTWYPGPLDLRELAPSRTLSVNEVREVRRRRLKGASIASLAYTFGCSQRMIRRAVQGIGPYTDITDPPPIPPVDTSRGAGRPSLSEDQVRELRRRRMAGASRPELERAFHIRETALSNALLGRKPYDQISNPSPLAPHAYNVLPNLIRRRAARNREGGPSREAPEG